MAWWQWMLLGLGLLVIEMATPGGLFALFFGLGAIVVGGLTALGISGPPWLQWLLFAALSIAALAALRGRLRQRIARASIPVDTVVGETATPLVALAPQAEGKAELRGTSWNARNVAEVRIEAGQRCRVERIDGLTLLIRPQ